MANHIHKASPEEIAKIVQRAGFTLPQEHLKTLCAALERTEAAAKRLRRGLQRNDEPANAFHVRKRR